MFRKSLSFIPRRTSIAVLSAALAVLVSCAAPVSQDGSIDAIFPKNCTHSPGDPNNCTPVAACLEGGDLFTGRAIGWLDGTFSGRTVAGAECSGQWKIQSTVGNYGNAQITCDDGRSGAAKFSYANLAAYTVWGTGELSDGGEFKVWAGKGLKGLLKRKYGTANAICAEFRE
ncbi:MULTISPECIES: hypothetical protein [unclassified Leisingera]|uniref:hypothetical protein n=1 Tax=unclassified Leisingera TaxID=2614906 RepID=UPI0002F174C3|nr:MULTISPECIES: hypothetical protein [unclassified Leisingera]